MVASSGQQNVNKYRTSDLSPDIELYIDKKADSIALSYVTEIERIIDKPKIIIGRSDILPTVMQPEIIYTWYYQVKGKDTLYHHRTIKRIK
jgi:hypothetical protein